MSEFERWEARYATSDYAFGKVPNYFLQSCKPLLPRNGRALAVADGEGRNGVWLAEQGLDVVSIDFSPAAQRKAKALAAEPKLLVMDEPSAGLSPLFVKEVLRILASLRERGLALLIAEQNIGFLEVATRVFVLEGGRIRFSGTVAEMTDNEALRRAYFGLK